MKERKRISDKEEKEMKETMISLERRYNEMVIKIMGLLSVEVVPTHIPMYLFCINHMSQICKWCLFMVLRLF